MTQQDVLDGLLDECRVDHVGLWELIQMAQFELGAKTAEETRRLVLDLVHELLNHPEILVGHPTADGKGFLPWNVTSTESLKRIEREWSALGRNPNIGEVVWFTCAS